MYVSMQRSSKSKVNIIMLNTLLYNSKNIPQNIIRNYARKAGKGKLANPGIQKRINLLEERNEANLEDVDVDELESDLMSVGQMHKEHRKELHYYRDKEKYWIVKQKYFKENQINFLTSNDKEQIRYLHQTNPTEWTIEKLSEGFPAMPETISKIIKSKWHSKNESKIENHDKAVENNWKLLKEGKLEGLPKNLVQHLLKFSSRKPINKNFLQKKVINVDSQKQGEFSSIISSYQNLKSKKNTPLKQLEESSGTNNPIEDKSIPDSEYGNKMVPLSYITKSEIKKDNEVQIDLEEKYLQNLFHGKESSKNSYIAKANDTGPKKINIQYPEKIIIPKGKYKKGYTYKVNDCYYDDSGEFLYRVPGMY